MAAALAAVTLVAAACGDGEADAPARSATSGPAPDLVVSAGVSDTALPRIPLAPGAALAMEFPERPRRVEATLGPGAPLRERPATATVTWRPAVAPAGPSPLLVLADLTMGRLTYTACVVPSG